MKIGKYLRKTLLQLRYHWLAHRLMPPRPAAAVPSLRIPPLQGSLPRGADAPLLIFAACDAEYFRRYGKAFIGSALENASGCSLHVHVYNPLPEQLEMLQALPGRLQDISFTCSWEKVDLEHLDAEQKGIYYYSVRFLRLAEVFAQADSNCLCLDVDALLMKPADRLLDAADEADLAFYARFDKFGNSTKLLAGTLFARWSPSVAGLLEDIGESIRRMVTAGFLLEKLDQMVIYDRFNRWQKGPQRVRFRAFDSSVIDLDFGPNGLVWYPKGQSKKQDVYQGAVEAYEALFLRHCGRHADGSPA